MRLALPKSGSLAECNIRRPGTMISKPVLESVVNARIKYTIFLFFVNSLLKINLFLFHILNRLRNNDFE
jgi:hypothetical protein